MLRKAMFAGSFYNSNPNKITKDFEKWFEQAEVTDKAGDVIGIISPHAGYMYSGFCASYAYKLLSTKKFSKAIIIHPSHSVNHFRFSVSPFEEYQTPLGSLMLDKGLAESVSNQGAEVIEPWYHQNEHSMEVQLPFLKYINPDVSILPIMFGNQNMDISRKLAGVLKNTLKAGTIVIASTDLSHYHTAVQAERMDRNLIALIKNLEPDNLCNNITKGKTEACGYAGILTLMNLAELYEKSMFVELLYTHSGISSGDYDRVVGYLSAALVKNN